MLSSDVPFVVRRAGNSLASSSTFGSSDLQDSKEYFLLLRFSMFTKEVRIFAAY